MNKLTLLFLTFSFQAFAQLPQWANYTNSQLINQIAFEDDSLVWVGTYGGLISIDRQSGERQIFQPSNSGLKGTYVASTAVDALGAKWIGFYGLYRFDGVSGWERFYDIGNGDTLNVVYEIKEASNGDLWIRAAGKSSTANKLYRYDGSTFENMESVFGPAAAAGNSVRYFDVGTDGSVWVMNSNKIQHLDAFGLHSEYLAADLGLLPNESFEFLAVGPGNEAYFQSRYYVNSDLKIKLRKFDGISWSVVPILGNDVWDGVLSKFFTDSQDNIWLLLRDYDYLFYMLKFDGSDWQIWPAADFPNFPPDTGIRGLQAVGDDGHWWFDMFTSKGIGLYEFDGTDWTPYDVEIFPFLDFQFNGLAFDCQNKAWISGFNYLTTFDGVTWKEISDADMGLDDHYPAVTGVAADTFNCNIWVSYYNNGLDTIFFSKYDGSSFTHYRILQGGDAGNILPTAQGGIWLTSAGKGVTYFDGNTFAPWFDESNSPVSNSPVHLALDAEGGLWVASGDKGLSRYFNGSWVTYNSANSPLQYPVSWVFIDSNQNIWIDNEGSPIRFDGLNWEPLYVTDIPNGIYSMAEDAGGILWFGGTRGVYAYDGLGMTAYTLDNAPLNSNTFYDIQADPFNNKWFICGIGATVYNENGLSNQVVNTPSGVSGKVVFDTDMDGDLELPAEPGLANQKILLEPDNLIAYSSFGGFYKFNPLPGDHQLSVLPEAGYLPTTTSPLDLLMTGVSQSGFDFGVWSADPPGNIELEVTAGVVVCDQTTNVWLQVNNLGLLPASGKIELNFNPILFSFISSDKMPASVEASTVTFDYTLDPYEYDPILVVFDNPNFVAAGETSTFTATATRVVNNQTVQTVMDHANIKVVCSYDPNDKQAEATGIRDGVYSLLADPLDYTIRFQNKGTYTAFNIVIRDTLDPAFDPNSFEILAYSHPVRTILGPGGVLTFYFDNINLPWEAIDGPGSQGFVKYRIAARAGLPDPTEVRNTAHIYFDFNPAIVTNTTGNILVESLTGTEDIAAPQSPGVSMYPNPAAGAVTLGLSFPLDATGEWTLCTLTGQPVRKSIVNRGQTIQVMDLSDMPPGLYIWQLTSDGKQIGQGKVVLVQ